MIQYMSSCKVWYYPRKGGLNLTLSVSMSEASEVLPTSRGVESLSKSGITRVRGFLDISYL